jgi:hypothetical protein
MAELKTKETKLSVTDFLSKVSDAQRRKDCFAIVELMKQITKAEPRMWGSAIVGFGSYHYKYASGHEGDSCMVGFSPRKEALVLYLMLGPEKREELLKTLGTFKSGKGCLYIKRLDDVHIPTLKKLILQSVIHVRKTYK